jgi:hypothetical protein
VSRRTSKVASVAFTGAAAAMTVGMVAANAQAASSWHIKNNGNAYTGPVKGKNNGAATLKDKKTGATLTCNLVHVTGSVPAANVAGTSPTVAKIQTTTFSSCTAGGLFAFKAHLNHATNLHAQTYNATSGTTKGFLGTAGTTNAISATISGIGNNCHAVITGSKLPGSYKNGTHSLIADPALTATLKVKSAKSCLGQLNTGDSAYFTGKFHITSPTALTISKK